MTRLRKNVITGKKKKLSNWVFKGRLKKNNERKKEYMLALIILIYLKLYNIIILI